MLEGNIVTESTVLIAPKKSRSSSHNETSVSVNVFVSSGRKLMKSLGFCHAFAYVFTILFGAGIFLSPGLVARETNNMGIALLVWILSGSICLLGALCFCELAMALKKTGGEYIFIKEIYGSLAGFCLIWAQTFVVFPTALAVMAVTVGEYCVAPFHETTSSTGTWLVKTVAISCLCVSLLANCVSTSFIGKTQVLFTVLQILASVFFILIGIWKVATGNTQNYKDMFRFETSFDARTLSLAFYNSLWAFDGWGLICTITEEMRNPERDIRLAILTGIPFVTVLFVLMNLSFMSVLTYKEIANSITVATNVIEKCFDAKLALAVPVIVTLFSFSAINAILCVQARSLLSASREGQLPEPLSYIHRSRRTPIPALVLQIILTTVWILPIGAEIQSLVTYFSFAVWLTYGFAISAVVMLRFQQPNLARPFKVWIANPIFMIIVSLFLIVPPYVKQPIESSICLACLLLAIPAYFALQYCNTRTPSCITYAKEEFYKLLLSSFNLVPCVYDEGEEKQGPVLS